MGVAARLILRLGLYQLAPAVRLTTHLLTQLFATSRQDGERRHSSRPDRHSLGEGG